LLCTSGDPEAARIAKLAKTATKAGRSALDSTGPFKIDFTVKPLLKLGSWLNLIETLAFRPYAS
jgi:hypothetical protein